MDRAPTEAKPQLVIEVKAWLSRTCLLIQCSIYAIYNTTYVDISWDMAPCLFTHRDKAPGLSQQGEMLSEEYHMGLISRSPISVLGLGLRSGQERVYKVLEGSYFIDVQADQASSLFSLLSPLGARNFGCDGRGSTPT